MGNKVLPKPNTQALSWFYGEYKKGSLILNPKYQRNPIWSIGQQCFLIDSLISGSPIPQVYINVITRFSKGNHETQYEVVDGQQRLRAILEFMNDEYSLIRTTAKSYPVSEIYGPHIGKKYSSLPESLQESIWNYPLAVQELREWKEEEIRALFRRLNYVVERLTMQELRHSQYFGEFVEAVESLADNPFWKSVGLFNRGDYQRMRDVEFISELFIILIDGIQDGQKNLDNFYAKYDVNFSRRTYFVTKFNQTINSLKTILEFISKSRFSKKADFYALFAAIYEINSEKKKSVNLEYTVKELEKLSQDLAKKPETFKGIISRYYNTVVEGPNKRSKREERVKILKEIISR